MNQPLPTTPGPFPSLLSFHNDRRMSTISQLSDVSEELDSVVDSARPDRSIASNGIPLSSSFENNNVSSPRKVLQKTSLPPIYAKSVDIGSKGQGNPNWRPMASFDMPPLKVNRSTSVEKPIEKA